MGILEMRSSIDKGNAAKNLPALPPTAPDWVVRGVYEKRNNLPLTPLPAEVRSKVVKLASAVRGIVAPKTTEDKAKRDALKKRLQAVLLS
jgi:hypothetical protein